MANAKARYLKIRPIQSSTLSFNMPGMIANHNRTLATLGARLKGFSLTGLYNSLGQADPNNGRLKFDAFAIRTFLEQTQSVVLFSLRAESLATSLEQAICQRQNAFLRTYRHTPQIIGEYEKLFPLRTDPEFPNSKLGRLERLQQRTDNRRDELFNAYNADGRTSVVRTTLTETAGTNASTSLSEQTGETDSDNSSRTISKADTTGKGEETSTSDQANTSSSSIKSLPMAYVSRGHHTGRLADYDPADPDDPAFPNNTTQPQVSRYFNQESPGNAGAENTNNYKLSQRVEIQESLSAPMQWNGADWVEVRKAGVDQVIQTVAADGTATTTSKGESTSQSTSSSDANTTGTARSVSKSTTKGVSDGSVKQDAVYHPMDYGHPSAENDILWHRKSLDLQDERLPHVLFSHRVPHLAAIMDNELRAIDLEIRQLQLNYIHTFLVSPLSGVITGIYKDLGENVQAGESVLQVENDEEVLVVGRVNFRGRMELGASVKITTKNAFESGQDVVLEGTVVAVRGHDADDDEYDVIFRCDNRLNPSDPQNMSRKLPLNFTYDHKDVSVEFS